MKTQFSPIRIAAVYAFFGVIWILFSDATLHALAQNSELESYLQTVKGWAFIFITAGLVYGLTHQMAKALNNKIAAQKHAEEQLQAALIEAERANQAKSEFLASMSHELRTPLNAVIGFAQLMQLDPNIQPSSTQHQNLEYILEGGNQLLELVNKILDLARIEAAQLDLHLNNVNANEIVTQCVHMTASLRALRNIKVIDHFSSGAPVFLFTDPMFFKQILINILFNAVEYNKENGAIIIEGRMLDYGYLRLSITDTGDGIAEIDQPGVFDLFRRLDTDPMIAKDGTGVGLTVSKMLVDRLAGRIGLKSEQGSGATFWVDLPLSENDDVLIWTNAIRVGVDILDKDHQVLVTLLNRIMLRTADDADVDDVITQLLDYTHYHFNREEAILRTAKFPGLQTHCALHKRLIRDLNFHHQAWLHQRSQKNLIELRKFMKGWLFNHILNEDKKYASFAKGKDLEFYQTLKDLGLEKDHVFAKSFNSV
ncbi:bacteriohemerythrin [Magnetovibrio blakemorei]|uniref:histidine kinase n=1 Tax=Magnetovibrio blakemorei TaxID=28181 RepID=A0A1E5Q7N9_9PROT|nr:bacteriohemerythrin [Magnetovibrio blakemorei]OEJ67058.1 hypothetical protein BEN30_09765 [Magnetovibrio blakemorei]